MATQKIQSGDQVKVISGNYKGTIGVVTKVVTLSRGGKHHKRAVVSGVSQIVNYRRANKSYNIPGQMNLSDRLIDISNLQLVDENGRVSKVKINQDDSGKKQRVYKSTDKKVTKTQLPKPPAVQKEST